MRPTPQGSTSFTSTASPVGCCCPRSPEPGGALLDYDNDGDLDLYLVQGAVLESSAGPGAVPWRGEADPRDRLYRNDLEASAPASLRFTDVTAESGIVATGYGMGVATGDSDNDGWTDLYVTNLGPNQLLRNLGDRTFADVTRRAGVDDPRWSTSAVFVDYDLDGWLDLFLTSYVDFRVDLERECYSSASAPDYCGPDAYDPVPDRLFHNRGDGTFEDVTGASRVSSAFGAGLGVVVADLDGDGWPDIYVANDGDPNQLWINQQGSGTFEDTALVAGVAVNRMGQPEAGMGVDAGDFDGDGDDDLFLTHLDGESNTLYLNQGKGLFEDRTIAVGLQASSLRYTGFGTGFFDYDNDGWLDLVALNGAVRLQERLARRGETYPLQQRNQLFRNRRGGGFVEVSDEAGSAFKAEEVSRGAIFGDVDNDGDTDVVVVNNNGPTRLMLNQVGNRHHWLGLRLRQASGREGLHARVEVVTSGGRSLWRRVRTGGSYCSANDPRVLVGLGEEAGPRTVRVHWPKGGVETFADLRVGRYWTLTEGEAAATPADGPWD